MSLLDLQRRTMAAVTRPLTAGYGMKAKTPQGKSAHEDVAEFIKPNDRLSSFERLEIYNRQYWFRLLGAMAEDFPGVAALLGDKRFERICVAYLVANPSRSFTLRNLGWNLEGFLKTYEAELPMPRELLLDVARLEWAHIEAFDNGESIPISAHRAGQIGESSRLGLQPHVRLLTVDYPVDNFVVAVHRAADEPGMASNAVTQRPSVRRRRFLSQLQPEKVYLAVHRHDEFVYYKRLDVGAYEVLLRIQAGQALADALEGALEACDDPAFVERIPGWFANWSELGWLIECSETTGR